MKNKSPSILIVDFEATCTKDNTIPKEEMEIIEIGSAIVELKSLEIVDTFESFVRPVRNAELSLFCKELTTITQNDVKRAPYFIVAVNNWKAFLSQFKIKAWGSWGNYDRSQIEQDCFFHKVKNPLNDISHLNIKDLFSKSHNVKKRFSLGKALAKEGIQFEGTPHRGIDDAINISKLLPKIKDTDPFHKLSNI